MNDHDLESSTNPLGGRLSADTGKDLLIKGVSKKAAPRMRIF